MAKAKPFLPITKRREITSHFKTGSKIRSLVQLLLTANKPISTDQVKKTTGLRNLCHAVSQANSRLRNLGYGYEIVGEKPYCGGFMWRMARVEQKRRA